MKKLLLSALLLCVSGMQAADSAAIVITAVPLRVGMTLLVMPDLDAIDKGYEQELARILADFKNNQADALISKVVDEKITEWVEQHDSSEQPIKIYMLQKCGVRSHLIKVLTAHWKEKSSKNSN